jgi:hypothetical protein
MKNNISKKTLREFGFLIGFAFSFFIGCVLPSIGGHPFRIWTLWVSLPMLILAIFKPALLFYPYRSWMKLGHILGWLNSHIILGLVFLIVLQPIAFIMRFFGYDPLRFKSLNQNTYKELVTNKEVDFKKIF